MMCLTSPVQHLPHSLWTWRKIQRGLWNAKTYHTISSSILDTQWLYKTNLLQSMSCFALTLPLLYLCPPFLISFIIRTVSKRYCPDYLNVGFIILILLYEFANSSIEGREVKMKSSCHLLKGLIVNLHLILKPSF